MEKKKRLVWAIAFMIIELLMMTLSGCGVKYQEIRVEYDGETEAGVVLDKNNTGFHVYGVKENGEEEELTEWGIKEPQTLEQDTTKTVTVTYKGLSYEIDVECSTSAIERLIVSYHGETEEGTVLDSHNTGFEVEALHKNGDREAVNGWEILTPQTLKRDSEETIVVVYEGVEEPYSIKCSTSELVGIEASYLGDTAEGTIIDSDNKDIVVFANYKNGKSESIDDWEVVSPVTLQANEVSSITIKYEDKTTIVDVEGTIQYYWNRMIDISPSFHVGMFKDDNGYWIRIVDDGQSFMELVSVLKFGLKERFGFDNEWFLDWLMNKVLKNYSEAWEEGGTTCCLMSGFGRNWEFSMCEGESAELELKVNILDEFEAVVGGTDGIIIKDEDKHYPTELTRNDFILTETNDAEIINDYHYNVLRGIYDHDDGNGMSLSFWFDESEDESEGSVLLTSRGLSLSSLKTEVIDAYGNGEEGEYNSDSSLYNDYSLWDLDTKNAFEWKINTYIRYKTQNGEAVVFWFDENDKVVAISFANF